MSEQWNHFGNIVWFGRKKDTGNRLDQYLIICGTINWTLQDRMQTATKIKFYEAQY